jgi:uroporphyrinogen-III synthase
MRRVLVLRPEPGASATVERARERGLDAIAVPLFEIEPVAWRTPDASGFDALLLTSANSVRCGGDQIKELRSLSVHAVGAATAAAARDAGFDIASAGDAGVDRLLGSLDPGLKLLHLAGEDRKAASDARQRITCVTVYRSRIRLAVELADVEGVVALIHSPRAGRRFAELIDQGELSKNTIAVAAISAEAAEATRDGWEAVGLADEPTDDALLVLAERLCNNTAAT